MYAFYMCVGLVLFLTDVCQKTPVLHAMIHLQYMCVCVAVAAGSIDPPWSSLGSGTTKLHCWSFCTLQLWIYHSMLLRREDRPDTGMPLSLALYSSEISVDLCIEKSESSLSCEGWRQQTAIHAIVERGFSRFYCSNG